MTISLRNDDPEIGTRRVSLSIVNGFGNDIEVDTTGAHHDHRAAVGSFAESGRWHIAENGAAGHERGNRSERCEADR